VWGHPSAVTAGYRFCEIARAASPPTGRASRRSTPPPGRDPAACSPRSPRPLTETVEALIWRAHTGRDAPPGEPAERMAEAAAWLPARRQRRAGLGDVAEYARDLLYRRGRCGVVP
jgi:hypothetical protein